MNIRAKNLSKIKNILQNAKSKSIILNKKPGKKRNGTKGEA